MHESSRKSSFDWQVPVCLHNKNTQWQQKVGSYLLLLDNNGALKTNSSGFLQNGPLHKIVMVYDIRHHFFHLGVILHKW